MWMSSRWGRSFTQLRQRARTHYPLPDERTQSFLVGSTDTPGRLIDSSRFSSYWKLLRVTAWVLRFVRHVRLQRRSLGELDASELAEARKYWIGEVQKDCFGAELQALKRGSPYRVNHWLHASTPFSTTGSYALAAGSSLLICQENKYIPFSSMGRTISQHT